MKGSSVLQNISKGMASLWKGCVNLFYSQVGRDKLSLQELNKGTLVYSQAEGQGPPGKPLSMIIIIKASQRNSFQHGVRIGFLPATIFQKTEWLFTGLLSAQSRTRGIILYVKHCTADFTYIVLFIYELRAELGRLEARVERTVQTIGTIVTSSCAYQISCYLCNSFSFLKMTRSCFF